VLVGGEEEFVPFLDFVVAIICLLDMA
jgi:hypothetical protein